MKPKAPERIWMQPDTAQWYGRDCLKERGDTEYIRADSVKRKPMPKWAERMFERTQKLHRGAAFFITRERIIWLLRRAGGE